MKEHDCRLLEDNKIYFFYVADNMHRSRKLNNNIKYVDSNDFLHNLNGPASSWFKNEKLINMDSFYIHGKYYDKEDWEIEVNRILMLNEI